MQLVFGVLPGLTILKVQLQRVQFRHATNSVSGSLNDAYTCCPHSLGYNPSQYC